MVVVVVVLPQKKNHCFVNESEQVFFVDVVLTFQFLYYMINICGVESGGGDRRKL